MKLDRIIIDAWDWVRRVVWFRRSRITKPPFIVLETYKGRHGILRRVTRDSPRAIDSWIYTPFRTKVQKELGVPIWDINILCDHLEVVEGSPAPKRRRDGAIVTHRIQVITASRYLEVDDTFQGETLFEGEWDLQGFQMRRDFYALQIMDKACKLLLYRKPSTFLWKQEIENAAKLVMGKDWSSRGERGRSPDTPRPDFVRGVIIDPPPGEKRKGDRPPN